MSTAEHRCIASGEARTSIRFADILGMTPSIIGKVELVYEGEQEGAAFVAERLIGSASKTLFDNYFPAIKKLKHEDEKDAYDGIMQWFFEQSSFELMDDGSESEYREALNDIVPLDDLISTYMPNALAEDRLFIKEFMLWALVEYKKLNKKRILKGFEFKDPYGAYLSNL